MICIAYKIFYIRKYKYWLTVIANLIMNAFKIMLCKKKTNYFLYELRTFDTKHCCHLLVDKTIDLYKKKFEYSDFRCLPKYMVVEWFSSILDVIFMLMYIIYLYVSHEFACIRTCLYNCQSEQIKDFNIFCVCVYPSFYRQINTYINMCIFFS